ncbi:ABC transporter ATP-binding protein [Arenicellales bacterium IMCC55707]
MEMVAVTAIIPLVLVILDPQAIIQGKILGSLYLYSGAASLNDFAMLLAFGLIGIFFLKFVCTMLAWLYEKKVLIRWQLRITTKIYSSIVNAEYEKAFKSDSASLINILSSVIPYITINLFHNLIQIINTGLIFLFLLNFSLLYSAGTIIIASLFGFFLIYAFLKINRNRITKLGREHQELAKVGVGILQASIFGLKDLKISGKQKLFLEKYRKHAYHSAQKDLSLQFIQNLPNLVVEFIGLATILSAFILTLLLSEDIGQAAAQISVLIFVGLRFLPLITRVISSLTMIRSCYGPVETVFRFYDRLVPESLGNCARDGEGVQFDKQLSFQNVSFFYGDDSSAPLALNNLSMTVSKGEHVGIVGPSGSGKTTLINIILGFVSSYSGAFKVDGVVISKKNIASLRQILAFVDQTPFLLNDDFIANVAFGESRDDLNLGKVEACLRTVGLWDHVLSTPHQMETGVGENGRYLSGGQRQRLAIARALYSDSKILILDEASSALDMDSEAKLSNLLETLKKKITIISIAHRLSTLKQADKIFLIERGKITANGTFAQLFKTSPLLRRYLDQSNIIMDEFAEE